MSYLEMALKVSRVRQLAEMPEPENGSASVPGVRPATCAPSCYEVEPGREAQIIEKTPTPSVSEVPKPPSMPKGVRLVRWEPKPAPVAIDVCSVVVDVSKFMELRDLNSRINFPWTIKGGWTIPQILDRLAQAGVEVEIDLKGEKP
jgi:hypothetical protein